MTEKQKAEECGRIVEFEVFLSNGWHKTFSVPCGHYGGGLLRKCADPDFPDLIGKYPDTITSEHEQETRE